MGMTQMEIMIRCAATELGIPLSKADVDRAWDHLNGLMAKLVATRRAAKQSTAISADEEKAAVEAGILAAVAAHVPKETIA